MEFLLNVFLPIAIILVLLIAIAAWIVRLALFFIYRIRNSDKPNPHEATETMGLPKGAVRTFFALIFTSIATFGIFTNDASIIALEDKKWLMGELGIVVAFYFGSKAVESFISSRGK